MDSKKQFKTIDEYIKTFPNDVQAILEKMRQTIRKAAPEAVETISYQMPTFKLNGRGLVYFAGFKNHVGFIQFLRASPHSKRNSRHTNKGRAPCSFPWTSRSL